MRLGMMLIFFLAVSSLVCAAADTDLTLEGIVLDPHSAGDSFVIINGAVVKQDETYEGYRLREIGADYVLLTPVAGGNEIRLRIGTSRTANPAPVQTPSPEAVAAVPVEMQMPQMPANFSGGMTATGLINLAEEVKVMAAMRQVATAAAVMVNMEETDSHGNVVAPQLTLKKMVERELIPKVFENGKVGQYVITINSQGYKFEVHADPLDPKSTCRHFMIDSDGTMYAEKGKQATSSSPQP